MSRMTAVCVFLCMIVAALHGPAFADSVTVDFDADFAVIWAPNPSMVVGSLLGWGDPVPGWDETSDIDTSGDAVIVGNGMVDSDELALLQAILAESREQRS